MTIIGSYYSCQNEKLNDNANVGIISVRIPSEPDRLNPILARSSSAIDIHHYLFFPLAEFDPITLILVPLLIDQLPEYNKVESGPYNGDYEYDMKIRDDAVWNDGQPITGFDYQFTVNTVFNPHVEAASWRALLGQIKEINVNPVNPKLFSVVVEDEYMFSREVAVNFNILPKHVYDSAGIMDGYRLQELKENKFDNNQNADLKKFAQIFSDVLYSREIVVGSGPYKLEDWVTNQWVRIERVDNWWGEKFKDLSVCFENIPQKIEFVIIPDETTSLSALKAGTIDVMARISPESFVEIISDSSNLNNLGFITPEIMQYYYLALNNLDPILDDKKVRLALASTLNTTQLIEELMENLASPTIGPFHPSKNYYADDLQPIKQDLQYAAQLLEESGWQDSNHNGTIDKNIDGKLNELRLKLSVSGNLGEKIALIFKENAKKVGIDIDINRKPMSLIRGDLRKRDYQIAALATRTFPLPDDPYQSWHTDNILGSGTNRVGFGNARSDSLIEKIRGTNSEQNRDGLYREFQQIIYEEQPMIFLFSPLERIAHSKSLELQPSVRRPGYFLNAAKKAS